MPMIDQDKPLMSMTTEEMEQAFDEAGRSVDAALLRDARRGEKPLVALACLALASSEFSGLRIVTYALEHGDGDGTDSINDTKRSMEALKLLKKGEELKTVLLALTGDLNELLNRSEVVLKREE